MRQRSPRAWASSERGAVAVIMAISLVFLLGMAAIAIDLSSFYKAQRQAQAAADAGALAAAYDLPFSTTDATNNATTYAQENDPGATVAATTPYGTTPSAANEVKVTVNLPSPSYFGQIFGVSSANVSASAVAGATGSTSRGAIFAYGSGGCSNGITLNGNSMTITGGIESNGNLTISQSNPQGTLSAGTYGTGCSYSGTTSPWTTAPYGAPGQNWPIDYRNSLPACTTTLSGNQTWSGGTIVNGTSQVICDPTGTLTVTGTMTNSCAPSTTVTSCPGVTFEAEQIVEGTSNQKASAPYSDGTYGLLFYQTGTDTTLGSMDISGNNCTWNGAMFAPNATINVTMNHSATGFIEGNAVNVNGNSFGPLTGDGPPVTSSGYSLLQ